MSKHWKEIANKEKHLDYMSTYDVGGMNIDGIKMGAYIYFVRECSFTFQFASLGQLDEMIEYVSKKTNPSTKVLHNGLEHYWQSWKERLPRGLLKGSKRVRILNALTRAKIDFKNEL